MKFLSLLLIFGFLSIGNAAADTIAFGKLKGIKTYDFSNSKVLKLYFTEDATLKQAEGCDGVATLTYSQHSEAFITQVTSIALTAYTTALKVRAYSSDDSCELDFLALQETNF